MKLFGKIIGTSIFAVLTGLVLKEKTIYLKPLADVFLFLIKIIAFPMIYFAISHSLSEIKVDSAVIMRFVLFTILTAFVAVTIGLGLSFWLKPGLGLVLVFHPGDLEAKADFTVFFVIGVAIVSALYVRKYKTKTKLFHEFIKQGNRFIFKIAKFLIYFSFIGIFAIISMGVGMQESKTFALLAKLSGVILGGFALQIIFLNFLVSIFSGISFKSFLKQSVSYQLLALSTGSSKLALPVTIDTAHKKLGLSKSMSEALLPIAASSNMNGLSIYLTATTVFFAQALGVELTGGDILIVGILSSIGTLGTSGISGGALMTLPLVLKSVGLPIEGVLLVATIDPILNAFRTLTNVTGDVVVTLCSQKQAS